MLELIKRKEIKKEPYILNNELKHFPSSVREWNNSVYVYNKNSLDLIPSTTVSAMKIIKGYFSLYNQNLEKNLRTKRLLLRFRRLSSNRIYISQGEFKHKNNRVLINIYLFNRQKHNYLIKLKNIYLLNFLTEKNVNFDIINTFKSVLKRGIYSFKKLSFKNSSLIKILDVIETNNKYKLESVKTSSNYIKNFYKAVLKLSMKKLRLFFIYKQLIHLNKSKINYTYLRLLKKHLEILYNKNVEFNLINLNRFYLNSDILFESVKLKIARNKRKIAKVLRKLKAKVKVKKIKWFFNSPFSVKNRINNISHLKSHIFNNIKYKHVTGFRLEARGRLSKRYTASRTMSRLTYNGSLVDLDSSYKGLSSVLLKGNLKSNTQFSKLSSTTRIGSFGIKG